MAGSGSGLTTELERILESDAWNPEFSRRTLDSETVMHIEGHAQDNMIVAMCLVKIMSPEFLDIAGIDPAEKTSESYVIGSVTDEWAVSWHEQQSHADLLTNEEFDEDRLAFIRYDHDDHTVIWERKGIEYAEVGVAAEELDTVTERILPFIPRNLKEAAALAITQVVAEPKDHSIIGPITHMKATSVPTEGFTLLTEYPTNPEEWED